MKDLIICGGGYSVKGGVVKGLWDKIRKKNIWSLNYSWRDMPYLPDAELWVDLEVWRLCENELVDIYNRGVKLIAKVHDRYKNNKKVIQYTSTNGIEVGNEVKGKIYVGTMGFCGTFALSLATTDDKPYDRVFLLGYDFGTPTFGDPNTHWSEKTSHRGLGKLNVYLQNSGHPLPGIKDYQRLVRSGYEIYNVSTEMDLLDENKNPIKKFRTNLKCFPIINYEKFFEMIKEEM